MSLKRAPNFPWTGERAKVYTYALSGLSGGRNYDGSDQEILEARAALRVLVTEITRFPVLASLAPEYVRSANIFCLPFVDKNRTDTDVLPGFDFDLASNYRTYIARLLSDQPNLASRLAGPGPFLVAFSKPIADVRRHAETGRSDGNAVLLVDMSGATAEAIPVYVKAFRAAAQEGRFDSDINLAPLRARFADIIVRLNAAVPFIADAYAGIAKAAVPMGTKSNPEKK